MTDVVFDEVMAYLAAQKTAKGYEPWEEHIHGDRGQWLQRTEQDHQAHLDAQRADADRSTRGYMVSPEGQAAGVTGEDFFKPGKRRTVDRWGSEEMKRWHGSDNTAQVGEASRFGKIPSLSDYRSQVRSEERDAYHRHQEQPQPAGADDEQDFVSFGQPWKPRERVTAGRSEDIDALGRSEHPNVDHYISGGIGHREGDEDRSVVGFLPTHLVKRYREHAGDWHGDDSRDTVEKIKSDITSGKGITNPLIMDYDHDRKWGYVCEGNHRLQAAVEAGAKTVPVRVYGRARLKQQQRKGIGAPMTMHTHFGEDDEDGEDYVPPAIHPHHFTYDDGQTKQAALVDFGGQHYSPHEWSHPHAWLPTGKIFGKAKTTFDPRLFLGDVMKPEVRDWIMARLNKVIVPRYQGWPIWARVYLAGSEATYWWGNNDLDILIGIQHDLFREANPQYGDMSDSAIDQMITQHFREEYDDEDATVPWDE